MIVIGIASLLCVAVTAWLVTPLMRSHEPAARRAGWVLVLGLPLLSVAGYLATGTPGLGAAPALFEAEGPRAEMRSQQTKELRLMKQVAATPDDPAPLLELISWREETGQAESAAAARATGRQLFPDDQRFR